MSTNVEIPGREFGDSSQLTNRIFYSGATCHMTPKILDFTPGSILETYKYIEVTDKIFVMAKKEKFVLKCVMKKVNLSSQRYTMSFLH